MVARRALRVLPGAVEKAQALRAEKPEAPIGFPLFLHGGAKNQLRQLESDPKVTAAFEGEVHSVACFLQAQEEQLGEKALWIGAKPATADQPAVPSGWRANIALADFTPEWLDALDQAIADDIDFLSGKIQEEQRAAAAGAPQPGRAEQAPGAHSGGQHAVLSAAAEALELYGALGPTEAAALASERATALFHSGGEGAEGGGARAPAGAPPPLQPITQGKPPTLRGALPSLWRLKKGDKLGPATLKVGGDGSVTLERGSDERSPDFNLTLAEAIKAMKALRVSHYGPTPQNPSLGRQFDQL